MPDLDKFLKSPEELEKVAITDRYRAMTHLSGATPPSLPALQFETPKRWFDRLPSLSINYSRVRDEAEPRTRAWRWGGLEIERIDDWGCAWLLLLYIVLGVALGGSCYLLSTPQEHKAVGVMATQISPITATFKAPDTTYTVELTAVARDSFQFAWGNTNPCGTFIWTGQKAIWHHPDEPGGCPNEPVHKGAISVYAVGEKYICKALYSTSAPGIGNPATCEAKPASVAPSATSVDSKQSAFWIIWPAAILIAMGFGTWFLSSHGPRAAAGRKLVSVPPRGAAVEVDPCAELEAWVAELRARIAAHLQELQQSTQRGDTYLPPALQGSIALDMDLLRKAEAQLARCPGFAVPDPYAPPVINVPPTGAGGAYLQHLLVGIEMPPLPPREYDPEPEGSSNTSQPDGPPEPVMQPMSPPVTNGPAGPVTQPPPQSTSHHEDPQRHCGPQVDQIFVDAINRVLDRLRTIFGPEPDQPAGMEFLAWNGWDLDFFVDPPGTCPGPHCPATITLCGLCHQHHILSDFMYGFICGYFGLTETVANLGGYAYQVFKLVMHGTSIDPAHYTEARPAYHAGVRLGQLLTMTAEERMVTVGDLCFSLTGKQLGTIALRPDCPPAPCVATKASKDFSIVPWSVDTAYYPTTPAQRQAVKGAGN